MSEFEEGQETETEVVAAPEGSAEPSKPAGYAPIDPNTANPEQVQERIDYIYGQLKADKRTLSEYRQIAEQQSRTIEELRNGVGAVVDHLQDRHSTETEASLKAQVRAAFESGDTANYWELQDKLDNFRVEKKISERDRAAAPVKPAAPSQPIQQNNESLPQEDINYINVWQDEKDTSGNLLRPWAHNTGNEYNPNPEYVAALLETQAVLKSPRFKNKSAAEKMAEVDRRMGLSKTPAQNSVMGGNLTGKGKPSKLTLTDRQRDIALKTVPLSAKIKNDADKIAWYQKQIEATKGAR